MLINKKVTGGILLIDVDCEKCIYSDVVMYNGVRCEECKKNNYDYYEIIAEVCK